MAEVPFAKVGHIAAFSANDKTGCSCNITIIITITNSSSCYYIIQYYVSTTKYYISILVVVTITILVSCLLNLSSNSGDYTV